jgi:putative ABC transport system permease protein
VSGERGQVGRSLCGVDRLVGACPMGKYFSYALTTLWHERQRYLPGILAVAFSALLIALQWGMLLGMFTFASVTVDRASAQIWLGGPHIQTVDLSWPIAERELGKLASQPEVEYTESYVQEHSVWMRPDGSAELCLVIGTRLEPGALGAVPELTPELRVLLGEQGAVVVDESDLSQLGIHGVGDVAEIHGKRAKVVGLVHGFRGTGGAHVFCSLETAHTLLNIQPDRVSYLLACCRDPDEAPAVVSRLRAAYPDLSVFTARDLSLRSRTYWLTKTKGGVALGYGAALGLLVGIVVTGQTLYGATTARLREYAVLWALGIPVRRMAALVLAEALCVGLAGVLLALPVIFLLAGAARLLKIDILLPLWLLVVTVAITLAMALASGLAALRSLRRIEPAALLR